MLEGLKQERENERWRAIFEVEQRQANYRAGTIAAMILNAQRGKETDKVWSAEDFFPSLKPTVDDSADEMTTAESVEYLREGFSLWVPTAFRQQAGLPD